MESYFSTFHLSQEKNQIAGKRIINDFVHVLILTISQIPCDVILFTLGRPMARVPPKQKNHSLKSASITPTTPIHMADQS